MPNRATVRKLASLSAAGAGALVLSANKAEAAIIYTPVTNTVVGYGTGDQKFSSFFVASNLAHTHKFYMGFSRRFTSFFATNGTRSFSVYGHGVGASSSNSMQFAINCSCNFNLKLFNEGATMGAVTSGNVSSEPGAIARYWGTSHKSSNTLGTFHSVTGLGNFNNKFALFTFNPDGTPLYGWVWLSGSVTDGPGYDYNFGPALTILGYAYDDTGAEIQAGLTDNGFVPEPG